MAQTTIRSRQEELAILEVNDLILFTYNSIYGQAFEVLTKNGQHRVCHGNDREQVVKEAIKWLEARAVLTGKPMAPGRMTAARQYSDALDAQRYAMLQKMHDFELKKLTAEAQLSVPNYLQKLSPGSSFSGKSSGGVGESKKEG